MIKLKARQVQRKGDSTYWGAQDTPILLDGELGYNSTENKIKIGDGESTWSTLPDVTSGDVFFAQYNSTTFAEIKEAYDAGKAIFATNGGTICQLVSYYYYSAQMASATFISLMGNTVITLVAATSGWSQSLLGLQRQLSAGQGIDSTQLGMSNTVALSNSVYNQFDELQEQIYSAYVTETVAGPQIAITDGADNIPIKSFVVDINATQSGSGDPSPSNVRQISGEYEVDILINQTTTPSITTTVNLPNTVYGGTLNVTTGILTTMVASYTFNGSESDSDIVLTNWRPQTGSSGWVFSPTVTPGIKLYEITDANIGDAKLKANKLKTVKYGGTGGIADNAGNMISITRNTSTTNYGLCMRVTTTGITTKAQIKQYLQSNPIFVIYELETPITTQLTPTELRTFLGDNYMSSSSGDIAVTYRADTALYIDKKLNP